MRFMLLQNYGPVESEMGPMLEWSQADMQTHIEFQIALNGELSARVSSSTLRGSPGPRRPSWSRPTVAVRR